MAIVRFKEDKREILATTLEAGVWKRLLGDAVEIIWDLTEEGGSQ